VKNAVFSDMTPYRLAENYERLFCSHDARKQFLPRSWWVSWEIQRRIIPEDSIRFYPAVSSWRSWWKSRVQ